MATQPKADLAIATLAVNQKRLAYECGLVKWCSQASALARALTASPQLQLRVEIVILTPPPDDDRAIGLHDCAKGTRRLTWDSELERKLIAYTNRDDIVSGLASQRHNAVLMQKLQFLSLVSSFAAILYADWDVDVAPSLCHAVWAFEHAFRAFRDDSSTQLLGSPDAAAPLNSGVLLFKPSREAHDRAIAWLRNGTDAIWDPTTGYDRIGRPSTVGLPRNCAPIPASVRGRSRRPPGGPSCSRFTKSRFVLHDKWEWGRGAGCEQGLLFYIFHARLRGYSMATLSNYSTRHYTASPKPWEWRGWGRALLEWHWLRDLPTSLSGGRANATRTRCARMLAERYLRVQQMRDKALANVTSESERYRYDRKVDPVSKARLRPFVKQGVF